MALSLCSQRRIHVVEVRIALHGDSGHVIQRMAQAGVTPTPHHHQSAFATGRIPTFPVKLAAEPGVKWPYVSIGSSDPPCSMTATAIRPLHWLDTKRYSAPSSAG